MLVDTARIQTGIKSALRFDMSELAALPRAVGSVPTHRHSRVAERTGGVGAVGEELAVLFGLVRYSLCGRRMSSDTFAVFTGGLEGAMIVHIDGGPRRGGGGLVYKYAICLGAFEIEFADCVRG